MTTDVHTEVPDVATAPGIEVPTLVVADRCDVGRCGAQAFVVTAHLSGFLYWCGHHYRAQEHALEGLKVLDNRTMINSRPGGSA